MEELHERFLTVLLYSQDQGYKTAAGRLDGHQFTGPISELIELVGGPLYQLANALVYRSLQASNTAFIEGDGINLTISK